MIFNLSIAQYNKTHYISCVRLANTLDSDNIIPGNSTQCHPQNNNIDTNKY